MRISTIIPGIVAIVGFVAACGGGGASLDGVAKLQKDCEACNDQACYDKLKDAMKAFEESAKKKWPKKSDAPKDVLKAYGKARTCRRKLGDKLREAEKAGKKPAAGTPATPPATK